MLLRYEREIMLHIRVLIAAAALLLLPALAAAQFERGDWELTLAGVGTSNKDFDEHAIGVSGGLGYFLLDPLELSLRQTLTYVKSSDSNATDASTIFALDWHFPLGEDHRLVPFIGGNVGFFYGDTVSDSLEYGPEAGVKYFVNTTTFIYFRAEYEFFSHVSGSSSTSNDDRQIVYGIGIGFRF
jgi:hypothetical protein